MHVAAQCDAFGALVDDDGVALDYDALGIYLRQDPKACEMNIAALMRTGMITLTDSGAFHVTNYSSERDETAAERKREQRKRDSERDDTDVTDMSRRDTKNVTDTSRRDKQNVTALEKEKEEEKEKDIEKEVFAQSANAPQKNLATSKLPPKTEPEQKRGEMFVAVADCCKIPRDSKSNARGINAAALWLVGKNIEPAKLAAFLAWWFANDWRGRKSEYPKPEQIVSEWPKFEINHTVAIEQKQNFARPTKGETQMANLRAGLSAFMEDS